MRRYLDGMQPWGAVLLRVVLGIAMLCNGWDKVVPTGGFHGNNVFSALQHWNLFVLHLGLPAWLGTVSALTEFFGGIALILGIFTRIVALLVACNMAVALLKVNIHHGYQGSQYSLALLVIAIMLVFTGAGTLALDDKIGLN